MTNLHWCIITVRSPLVEVKYPNVCVTKISRIKYTKYQNLGKAVATDH